MTLEVMGLDHIYITVSDLARSAAFYDDIMKLLGFRKGTDVIGSQPHIHYFNRVMQYTLRPGRPDAAGHDPLAPGLHHLCFQVTSAYAVDLAGQGLKGLGILSSEPRIYPEYNADYYAIFFKDPDGIELEIVARTHLRNLIVENWGKLD